MRLRLNSESSGEFFAETTDENPITVEKIGDALPLEGEARTWGDEIYFRVDISSEPENPREVVKEGEIAFWLEEPCICIFFGKTPISKANEIRAYGPVNVFAKVEGDLSSLKRVKHSERIRIEKA